MFGLFGCGAKIIVGTKRCDGVKGERKGHHPEWGNSEKATALSPKAGFREEMKAHGNENFHAMIEHRG